MKILVTGSAGKIGGAVVPVLKAKGHEVVLYDLRNGQDIFNRVRLEKAMSGCARVVHLAGIPYPKKHPFISFYHSNCDGTRAVVDAAAKRGVKRLIYSGSTAFYGMEEGIPYRTPFIEGHAPITCYVKADEITCANRHMGYDISKIIAEQILAYYGLMKILEIVVLRFGPVNPGQGCTLKIAAEAMLRAVEHSGPFWYEIFNIIEDQFEWADSSKAQRVLGIKL